MNQIQDNEIELFDLFQTLWHGKWLISATVAIAVLLGGAVIVLKDTVYESKFFYTVDTIPPFYDDYKVSQDFKKKFFSNSVFKSWKEFNNNKSILFEDFSATEVVDGFVLSKQEDEMLVTLVNEKNLDSFVLVRSNNMFILDNFFKYAHHINRLLKQEYVMRAKSELQIIESRFKDLGSADSTIVDTVLSIDRYIVSAEKGANVLVIQRPTMPKKVSPKSSLILALSVVLGGMVGVLFILIRNAISERKERLAKA